MSNTSRFYRCDVILIGARLRAAVLALCASALLILGGALAPSGAEAASGDQDPSRALRVNAQGMLVAAGAQLTDRSPGGRFEMRLAPGTLGGVWASRVEVRSAAGAAWVLEDLRGAAFFLSDLGLVVTLEPGESPRHPAPLFVYDLRGRELLRCWLDGPHNPTLSADGRFWVCGTRAEILRLDLATLGLSSCPLLTPFCVSRRGSIAGLRGNELVVYAAEDGSRPQARVDLAMCMAPEDAVQDGAWPYPRRLAFAPDDAGILLLFADRLVSVDPQEGTAEVLLRAPQGAALRDLRVTRSMTPADAVREEEAICVGLRRTVGCQCVGEMIVLDAHGARRATRVGERGTMPRAEFRQRAVREISWPLEPDEQHPVGNTYGEFQQYGGAPYLHPGVDVMGSAGQEVFAVRGGVVKAILTTAGEWHWRVAIGDSATAAPCDGYLYAHLDEVSIAVAVGDPIVAGQYLGVLVEWPVYDFHHLHFARIRDEGDQWYGQWLCTENPHLAISPQSEEDPPFFAPARDDDLLAFCTNETSQYLDPGALQGAVDIIARVGDRIESSWVCTVQEIRYSIYRRGFPEYPVVDDLRSVFFNMPLDTYQGGPFDPFLVRLLYKDDAVCNTHGDYDNRDFYHVITNSDGDDEYEESDQWAAWDTMLLPDGDYVVRVTIADVAGNTVVDSMLVRTANANPAAARGGAGPVALQWWASSPTWEQASVSLVLSTADRVGLSVHDLSGRLLRTVGSGPLAAGTHVLVWDGRTDGGRRVPPGVYFWRLATSQGCDSRRIVMLGS